MALASPLPVTTCPQCHLDVPSGSHYCPNCGFTIAPSGRYRLRDRTWWKVLLLGLALYYVDMKSLAAYGNPNFVPTVLVLGGFLVPVTFVIFLYERGALYDVPLTTVALTFFYGGVLGTLGAQFLEAELVGGPILFSVLAVGFSEELAKLLGVVWLLRRRAFATELHGLVLGAAAGMGFAAFESMGYGFTFLLQSHGDLGLLGEVLVTRGLLSPLAHGTWTAIIAGVLWRERAAGHGWFNGKVIRAFIIAIVLHALWDLTAGLAPIDLPGLEFHWRAVDLAVPALSLPLPGLILGFLGLWILRRLFRESRATVVTGTA